MPTLPFSDSTLATSDATGGITFTGFQQPRVGMWRTGSLSVVRSDGTAVVPSSVLPITWKAYVAKTIWGTWYNDQPSNLVQTGGPAVEVRGTNLAASTAYQCVFTGYDSDSPQTLSPLPAPAPPPSGFTTIVSGINNAVAISANPQYLNAAGGLSGTPVWFPVVVGTALEIAYFEADAVNQRLTPLWSTTGTGAGLIVHNADTFDVSFVAPGNVMQGMTYLNHAPYVAFLIQGVGGVPRLVVNTGLPPVVRAPSVPQGVLLTASGNIGPNAVVSVPLLCPYTGPAVLSVLLQNAAGAAGTHAFWVDCNGTNYLGTSFSWAHAIVDWVSDNNTVQAAVIEPRVIHVPPLINSVVLTSQNPNTLGYTLSVVPLGP